MNDENMERLLADLDEELKKSSAYFKNNVWNKHQATMQQEKATSHKVEIAELKNRVSKLENQLAVMGEAIQAILSILPK